MEFRINAVLCGNAARSVCSVTRIMFAAFRVECFGLPAFAASISDGNSSLPFSLRVQREIIREQEFGLFLRISNIAEIDLQNWTIPASRRFRAIRIWFMMKWFGKDGMIASSKQHIGEP